MGGSCSFTGRNTVVTKSVVRINSNNQNNQNSRGSRQNNNNNNVII